MVVRTGYVLSAALGAGLGFGASFFWRPAEAGNSSNNPDAVARALRSSRDSDGERHAGEAGAVRPASGGRPAPPPATLPKTDADQARNPALAAELERVRLQERQAQKQIGDARKRIDALEHELGVAQARNNFDLTPEDWRKLGQQGVLKYRVPCNNPQTSLTDAALDAMALAPEDRPALERAFENSASRLQQQLTPVCAAALGGRVSLARAIGVDGCRHIIVNTAPLRGDDTLSSTRKVAAIMAGDATVTEDMGMTDIAFLAFAEESSRFERELAEAFGPDEAHRIVNSPDMCFSISTHRFEPPPSASTQK